MAFAIGDLVAYLSTGSAGAVGDPSTPAASLGQYASSTPVPAGLFDTISDADNRGSVTDYRCVLVKNTALVAMPNVRVWVVRQTVGGATVTVAVDPTPASDGSTGVMALAVPNETTAPAGISGWSAPDGDATGLPLGTLLPGFSRPVWVRRKATNSAALTGDGFTLRVTCDQA